MDKICKAWNERLKEDGLKYFKASEYNSLTGDSIGSVTR